MNSIPIGKRTRTQHALREKEFHEITKKARRAALSKQRNEKNKYIGVKDGDEENVNVVDEAEYLRRASKVGNRESSPDEEFGFGGNSDDSVQIIGEQWNPLGADFGYIDDKDADDHVGSEGSDDDSDGHYPSPLRPEAVSEDDDTSMEEDDNSSDEDFKVNEAEMRSEFDSEYSSSDASSKYGMWKGETSAKYYGCADNLPTKINEHFLDEDIQSRVGVSCHYGSKDKGKLKNDTMSDKSGSCEKGSYIHSFASPFYPSSKNGVNKERNSHLKKRSIGIKSKSKNDPRLQECGSLKTGGIRKRGRPPKCKNVVVDNEPNTDDTEDGDRERDSCVKKRSIGIKSKSKNDPRLREYCRSKIGGSGKRGRPRKRKNSVVENEPYIEYTKDGDEVYIKFLREKGWQSLGIESAPKSFPREKNGRSEKCGKIKGGRPLCPSKGKNVVVESESDNDHIPSNSSVDFPTRHRIGSNEKKWRPPKNWYDRIKGISGESGKRGRGRPSKGKNVVGEYCKPHNDLKPKTFGSCEKYPFVHSSAFPSCYRYAMDSCDKRGRMSKSWNDIYEKGGPSKRDRPTKGKIVVVESENDNDPMPADFGKYKASSSEVPHKPHHVNGGDRKRVQFETKNVGISDKGGKRKRGRPSYNSKVEKMPTPQKNTFKGNSY